MGIIVVSTVEVNLGEVTNSCFVIMPFSATFESEYTKVIKLAVESLGLTCVRGDQIYSRPQIMSDIWKALRSARVVIAELSEKNVNVFYEIGLAHALGKPVIIITRNEQDVPFDLKALRYLYYDTNNPAWGEDLKKDLKDMLTKVISETEFGTVFDGIKLTLPKEYRQSEAIEVISSSLYNLSGIWEGEMNIVPDCDFDLKLELDHAEPNITGKLLISYDSGGERAIVQESVKGTLIKNGFTLFGSSYTFLKQGKINRWAMDSFYGKVTKKGKEISGNCSDEDRNEGTFIFRKIR